MNRHCSELEHLIRQENAGPGFSAISALLNCHNAHKIADYLKIVVYQTDLRGRWLFLNEAWHSLTGYTTAESIGRSIFEFVPPGDRAYMESELRTLQTEKSDDYRRKEARIVSKDGNIIHVEVHGQLIKNRHEGEGFIIGMLIDISERKNIEEQLCMTRRRKEFLLNALPVVFYAVDGYPDQLRTQWVSDSVGKISGFPAEYYLKHPFFWESRLHPDDRERVLSEAVQTAVRGHTEIEYRLQHADGSYRWLLDQAICVNNEHGQTKEIIGCWLDITDRKQAEEALIETQEQLLQAHKLESVGRLAGGVAHDFNNLLTAIIGNAGLMQMNLQPDDPQQEYVHNILEASNRAADLVRQLLAFARKQVIEPKRLDINCTLSAIKNILERLPGENIELKMSLSPELPAVQIDPVQLEQVVLNLVVNARDAMSGGGQILIETKQLTMNEFTVPNRSDFEPGPYVMLAVHDTGTGIAPADLPHIFEPFFTTKEVGKGTGLGLATCYGIIKQAKGHIAVQSELHHGTVFRIYLPAMIREAGEN